MAHTTPSTAHDAQTACPSPSRPRSPTPISHQRDPSFAEWTSAKDPRAVPTPAHLTSLPPPPLHPPPVPSPVPPVLTGSHCGKEKWRSIATLSLPRAFPGRLEHLAIPSVPEDPPCSRARPLPSCDSAQDKNGNGNSSPQLRDAHAGVSPCASSSPPSSESTSAFSSPCVPASLSSSAFTPSSSSPTSSCRWSEFASSPSASSCSANSPHSLLRAALNSPSTRAAAAARQLDSPHGVPRAQSPLNLAHLKPLHAPQIAASANGRSGVVSGVAPAAPSLLRPCASSNGGGGDMGSNGNGRWCGWEEGEGEEEKRSECAGTNAGEDGFVRNGCCSMGVGGQADKCSGECGVTGGVAGVAGGGSGFVMRCDSLADNSTTSAAVAAAVGRPWGSSVWSRGSRDDDGNSSNSSSDSSSSSSGAIEGECPNRDRMMHAVTSLTLLRDVLEKEKQQQQQHVAPSSPSRHLQRRGSPRNNNKLEGRKQQQQQEKQRQTQGGSREMSRFNNSASASSNSNSSSSSRASSRAGSRDSSPRPRSPLAPSHLSSPADALHAHAADTEAAAEPAAAATCPDTEAAAEPSAPASALALASAAPAAHVPGSRRKWLLSFLRGSSSFSSSSNSGNDSSRSGCPGRSSSSNSSSSSSQGSTNVTGSKQVARRRRSLRLGPSLSELPTGVSMLDLVEGRANEGSADSASSMGSIGSSGSSGSSGGTVGAGEEESSSHESPAGVLAAVRVEGEESSRCERGRRRHVEVKDICRGVRWRERMRSEGSVEGHEEEHGWEMGACLQPKAS